VQDGDAIKASPVLYNNSIAVTDKGMVVLQNRLHSQKDEPGSHSEACASSHNGVQAINIKVEEFSNIKDREDHVPMTAVGIKAEHEVSCVSTVRHVSVTSRIACFLSHLQSHTKLFKSGEWVNS
jgi:hypothetical protein